MARRDGRGAREVTTLPIPKDIRFISFDCYGTLIDWEAGLTAVLVPWARGQGLDLTAEQLLASYSSCEAEAEAGHRVGFGKTRHYRGALGHARERGAQAAHREQAAAPARRLSGRRQRLLRSPRTGHGDHQVGGAGA